jgi:hypothetical protein
MAISLQSIHAKKHKYKLADNKPRLARHATISTTSNNAKLSTDSPRSSDNFTTDNQLNRKARRRKIHPIPSSAFDEGASLDESSRLKFIIRNTPVENSHYIDVWQRAKNRLKIQFILQKLLYGNRGGKRKVTINWDHENVNNENNSNRYRTVGNVGNEATNQDSANDEVPLFMIHPNSKGKSYWNLIVAILLIYTATIMPFALAFIESQPYDAWFVFDLMIDILFFIDVLVNCNTAYYNSEGKLISSRIRIFCNYLRTWLIIDLIACFPFGYFEDDESKSDQSSSNYNNIIRFARLPRLYRLLRISRVFKAFKHYREMEMIEKIQDFLSIKHSIMRLIKSITTIIICLHIATCLWYYSSKVDGFNPDTWVVREGYIDDDPGTIYITSLYWALTTFCTVGYGDISAKTMLEKILAMGWMLFGLFFFSFTISSLSSMLSNIDSK